MQRLTFSVTLLVAAGAMLTLAGCKSMEKPVLARTDAQIAGDIQSKLSSEQAFSGQNAPNVNVAVDKGVATLTGQASDDNTRLLAANDASQINGVKEVVNDLTLPTDTASNCAPPPVHAHLRKHRHIPAPLMMSSAPPPPPVAPPPPAPMYASAPPPPPMCACGPAVVPAAPVVYGGYGVGIGIYGRPGWVRPARPWVYGRPGFRGGYYRR